MSYFVKISSLLLKIHHALCQHVISKFCWTAPGVSDAVSAALQGIGLETIPMPKWWTWSTVLNCGSALCLIIADKEWLIPGGLGYRHHSQTDFFHVSDFIFQDYLWLSCNTGHTTRMVSYNTFIDCFAKMHAWTERVCTVASLWPFVAPKKAADRSSP